MKIQPINPNQSQQQNPSFQKLIIKQGSFALLKQSKYFPDKSYPNYSGNLRFFYQKLMKLRKAAEKNELYNVVLKPDKALFPNSGKIVVENASGVEQFGFTKSFDELLRVPEMEPKRTLTEKQDPKFLDRWLRNWRIKRRNNKLEHKQIDMRAFLDIVYKRIADAVNNAEYLSELNEIKNIK